jgi:hypothetical protein
VPIKSIAELIAYIKANPDKLSYGSSGTGQSPHLTGAWFLQFTGLKMVHVPFRGAGHALQAALGGEIQILFDNLYPSLPQVQDGKLNAMAVTTPARSPSAPDIPTMRESAPELAKFDVSSWFGVFLPKRAGPDRRGAQSADQGDAGARRDQEEHRRDGRTGGLRHAGGVFRFRADRDGEVCRHHREGRPADGGEVIWLTCGAGDLIQLKRRSTAAASPTANIVPG